MTPTFPRAMTLLARHPAVGGALCVLACTGAPRGALERMILIFIVGLAHATDYGRMSSVPSVVRLSI
jgi:hypothetical protein